MEKSSISGNGNQKEDGRNNDIETTKKYSLEVPFEKNVIGKLIKGLRKIRNYSQTRLGREIGVQKAQVSKLENSENNITLGTMLKVFKALKATITIKVELDRKKDVSTLQSTIEENENGAVEK